MRGAAATAFAALLALLAATPAQADYWLVPPPVAKWMTNHYPVRAWRQHIEGHTRIQCQVTAEGLMSDCKLLDESPAGYEFGDAALQMSVIFQMVPKTENGHPVPSGPVIIPVDFKLPPGMKPRNPPSPAPAPPAQAVAPPKP